MNKNNKDTFTRSDIEKSLRKEFPDLTKSQITIAIEVILDSIVESVALDEKVEIRGFGALSVHRQKPRLSRNPRTGQKIFTPEKKTIHFKMSKELFNKVNEKKK